MTLIEIDRLRELLTDVADRLDAEVLELRTKLPRSAAAVRTQAAKLRAVAESLPATEPLEDTKPLDVSEHR